MIFLEIGKPKIITQFIVKITSIQREQIMITISSNQVE